VHIAGNRVTVSPYRGETDYGAEVLRTFAKFKQGAVKDYRVKLTESADMSWVESRILDLVIRLHPDLFESIDQFCARYGDYVDHTIRAFDREVQFYLAYLEYLEPIKSAGLSFCYPRVCARSKEVRAEDSFDLALATKLVSENAAMSATASF
jgi:hypothetical protein